MSHRTASQRSAAGSSSRVANGAAGVAGASERKRSASRGLPGQNEAGDVPRQKKARTEKRPQPSFKPKPIRDRDASPEELGNIPPPPSTKKIARLRESMGVERARIETPAPARAARSLRYGSGSGSDSDDDPNATRAQSLFTPKPPKAVPHLLFKPVARPRPSAAPPPSPGLPLGPPPTAPRRRARKSRLGDEVFDSVVPLPLTDTPVIKKNRELRKDAERRSSLGMRGQRASSSFGRGEPSYPHSSVRSELFYQHLPVDQPEPIRARWLISWCAKRALDEQLAKTAKGKKKTEQSAEIDKLLSDVVDDFVANVAKGNVDTNVFGDKTATSSAITVRPHPRNLENRKTLEREEAIIKRLKAEDRDWNRIAAKTNDLQAITLETTRAMRNGPPQPDMTEATDSFKRMLRLSDNAVKVSGGDLGPAGNFGEVEFEVDMLHQTSHQANQYMHQAQRFLDGIFSSLAADLRSRDGQSDALPPLDEDGPDTAALLASAAAGPSRPTSDPMNMLRALAVADSQQQSAEAVAKAAAVSVAPTASSTRTQAMTPRRTGTTATPRRQSVYGRGTSTPGRR